jgi:NADH dehydrogenase/NADH:ubiquinone oxidoreductase subunit G
LHARKLGSPLATGILLDLTNPKYQKRKAILVSQQMSTKILTFLILSFTAATFAEDFTTINGKTYKDATVTRVEPDGIVVQTKSGVTKLYFTELPKDVKERFHYDSEKAASYSAEQAANYVAYQKQQEETRRQRADADAKNNAVLAAQQAAANRTQALQARYAELQKQEDQLLLQIGQAKQPGPSYRGGKNNRTLLHQPNPQKSQLPVLQSHLSDVRHEKTEVRKQLEKASPNK